MAMYPTMKVDLRFTERVDIAPRDGVDIAIRLGAPVEKSFDGRKLASARRVLCASPAYLAGAAALRTPGDVRHHARLGYRHEDAYAVWVFETADGQVEIPADGPLQSDSETALHRAARDGLGLALLPHWMVAADLAAGKLVRCLPKSPVHQAGYTAELYAVYPRGEFVSHKIKLFVDHLERFIKDAISQLPE